MRDRTSVLAEIRQGLMTREEITQIDSRISELDITPHREEREPVLILTNQTKSRI